MPIMSRRVSPAPVLILLLVARAAVGQTPSSDRMGEARRVSRAPVVDGRLDDVAWQGVQEISEFLQKEPTEGAPPTETTRVRVIYDDGRLYLGVELLDSDPSQIRATELRRDDTLESDDSFAVLLDTFHDHRNAFLFRINPRGTRFDALVRNENRYLSREWDEQWIAAADVTDRGWTAELSIPFKILRFSSDALQTWGLNFERVIKRKNELVYWTGWNRNFVFTDVSQAGHLTGLRDIRQVERLRLRPYLVAGSQRFDAVSSPQGTRGVGEVGIDDLKFAVTSNLTADLAVNPDFAQTEVDDQRVNLTRFSLYFPEKRQFFVEGADSLRMGIGLLHFGPPPLEIFYSRRVGLSEAGAPVPIVAGGKLTGKVRGFDLGIIDVETAGVESGVGENFGAARVRKEVLGRSYVGAIVTSREGRGVSNRVAAADARFVFKEHLNVGALLARSFDPGVAGEQWVRHAGAEWRADLLDAGATYLEIQPNFNPGIGFVRRRERMIGSRLSFKPRPGGDLVRQFELTPSLVYFHDADSVIRTRQATVQFATSFESGDRIEARVDRILERLPRPFRIGGGVVLPVARYDWSEAQLAFRAFNGRKVSGRVAVDVGDFYNGTKRGFEVQGDVRLSQNLSLAPTYSHNDVELVQGAFDTNLLGLRANVSFTTSVLTSAFLQYNSSGDLAALQVRFNYIFRTIDNIFIVYNETRFVDGVFEDRANRSLVFKTTYSLHR